MTITLTLTPTPTLTLAQVEAFDSNMISNANLLVKQGLLQRPLDFGFVMGAPTP